LGKGCAKKPLLEKAWQNKRRGLRGNLGSLLEKGCAKIYSIFNLNIKGLF
jgi:hypothetical protein